MRFCSRCGFTLVGIALVVQNNGIIPPAPGRTSGSSRNRIMLESAILTVFAWAVALATTYWFNDGGMTEGVAKFTSLLFFVLGLIGLARFLYGFVFAKDIAPVANAFAHSPPDGQVIAGEPGRAALPPQQSIPISDYPLRVNTKEMSPRMSVTENTTRLLDE